MPNDQQSPKTRIDAQAKQALANINQVIDKHKDLELELKPIKESLERITLDPHRATQ